MPFLFNYNRNAHYVKRGKTENIKKKINKNAHYILCILYSAHYCFYIMHNTVARRYPYFLHQIILAGGATDPGSMV